MEIRKFNELGSADFGWLKARHHFSFGRYYDPARMEFGILRVVNDDRVAAGSGFEPHPHKDMEIITYVRKGEISHGDNMGNKGVTQAGSVQVMSAGAGVVHSEHASETEETVLYQIWILPREKGVAPRWDMAEFPQEPVSDKLRLLVSGRPSDEGKGALMIHADAALWGGKMVGGTRLEQDFGKRVYVLVSAGEVKVNGHKLAMGDAAALVEEGKVALEAVGEAEVVVIGLPL
jgi:hypothetical protein